MSLIVLFFAAAFSNAENYFILRLEPHHNQAVIATVEAQKFSVGNEFTVETPQGACHLVVKKIISDYIYLDAEQCQREYLGKGTPVSPRQNVVVDRIEPATEYSPIVDTGISSDSVSTDVGYINSDFYDQYIKNRLSATVSYLTGSTLDGRAQLTANTAIEDFRGSNTISLGTDYTYWNLPYNLSLSGGSNYSLPRSYGRFQQINNGASQTVSFPNSAKVETLSLFSNLRYHWSEQTMAYFGLNHLFVSSSGFAGEMSGDFGFHVGARHYLFENFFADGSINFYNLDYEVGNQKFDYSLTELEIKAGYTF